MPHLVAILNGTHEIWLRTVDFMAELINQRSLVALSGEVIRITISYPPNAAIAPSPLSEGISKSTAVFARYACPNRFGLDLAPAHAARAIFCKSRTTHDPNIEKLPQHTKMTLAINQNMLHLVIVRSEAPTS